MLTDYGGLASQLSNLKRAVTALGRAPEVIELGNEFYRSLADVEQAFPTAADYAKLAVAWSVAVRELLPGVPIAVVGAFAASSNPNADARERQWNGNLSAALAALAPELELSLDCTLHAYAGSGLSASLQAEDGSWATPAVQAIELQRLRAAGGVETMLSGAARVIDAGVADAVGPGAPLQGMGVWMTESGLFDRIGPVRMTWAHGLFTAAMQATALSNPAVRAGLVHALSGNPMFTGLWTYSTSLEPLCCGLAQPVAVDTPTAVGVAAARLAATIRAGAGAGSSARMQVPGQRLAFGCADCALLGFATLSPAPAPSVTAVAVVNLGPNKTALDLDELRLAFPCQAAVVSASAGPTAYIVDAARDMITTIASLSDAAVSLPAFSILSVTNCSHPQS
jgi:hypothetical protein